MSSERKGIEVFTSLVGGSTAIETNTNKITAILTAKSYPFQLVDCSLDATAKDYLKQHGKKTPPISYPTVFLNGEYIGGAEEIVEANDFNELAELLKGAK